MPLFPFILAKMTENLFQRLRDDASPSEESRDRVRASIQARIATSTLFEQAKAEATPSESARSTVWNRVISTIESPASSLLERIGAWLTPSNETRSLLRGNLLLRLQPVPVRSSYTRTKWVAAFAVFALAVRVSPVLLLAPHSVAESTVLLIPTAGAVEISLRGLWQPVDEELTLSESVSMRTNGGQATVLLHDDGTIRLDSAAAVTLYDLSDRPEPALDGPTLALNEGRVWVQGLLPAYVRGLTIATPSGDVVIHNGSVSLALEGGQLIVQVWDHSATVRQGDRETLLVTGEQARFSVDGSAGAVSRMPDSAYDNAWVTQNLERDAVHQRAVAQMQRERSASKAGILPTSPLYSMKRVAEQVDVLLTLDPDAKLQKQIGLASTRLNEAVALVSEGSSTGASIQMEEYRETLQAIASGSGGNSAAQFLIRQEVAINAAGLSAAQPTDAVYSVKKAILEASADLSVDVVDDSQVQSIILVETLDALREALEQGDSAAARASYDAAAPYLSLLEKSDSTTPEVRKEALALLTQAAGELQESASGTGVQDLAAELEPFLPQVAPVLPVAEPLTDEEVVRFASLIVSRIDTFDSPRPRLNQLRYEISLVSVHPDGGRILRQLYHLLPGQDILSREVREAIQNLRK
jgi:hypothetical protein